MNETQKRMEAGLCPDCEDGVLHHGPWTQTEIQAVAEDMGMTQDEFTDSCDDCFIDLLCVRNAGEFEEMCRRQPILRRFAVGPGGALISL